MKQCEHLAPNAQTAANAIATDTALGQMVARLASLSPAERSEAAIEADFLLNAAAECWPEITQGGRNVRKTLAAPVSCSCRCCGRARPLRWVYRSPDLLAVEAEA